MVYERSIKLYVCGSCGCTMNQQQLLEERERQRTMREREEKSRRKRDEYLEWWVSAKK